MSEVKGYVGIWRKLEYHWLWNEDRPKTRFEAWIDLIWCARHEEKNNEVLIKGKVLICHYGESLRSLLTLSRRWGWSKSKVRRFLELLEKERQIDTVNETVTTRITICNYEQYDPKKQKRETVSETHSKRTRNALETHSNPKKNVKNVKNVKNGKNKSENPLIFNSPQPVPDEIMITEEIKAYADKKGFTGSIEEIIEAMTQWAQSQNIKRYNWYAQLQGFIRREINNPVWMRNSRNKYNANNLTVKSSYTSKDSREQEDLPF